MPNATLMIIHKLFFGSEKLDEKKKGKFTIEQKKKKSEIIEEGGHKLNVPNNVGDQEKKALDQTGDDATSGW
jgi:hypothetical protein